MINNNYNNDPIYGIVESTGDTIKIDVLDSEWDINRKFRFDNKFRWNYSMYAMNQDYIIIKISFGEIECIEMVLDSHLGISIGIDITFGGIGRDILSITIGDIGIVHGDTRIWILLSKLLER